MVCRAVSGEVEAYLQSPKDRFHLKKDITLKITVFDTTAYAENDIE